MELMKLYYMIFAACFLQPLFSMDMQQKEQQKEVVVFDSFDLACKIGAVEYGFKKDVHNVSELLYIWRSAVTIIDHNRINILAQPNDYGRKLAQRIHGIRNRVQALSKGNIQETEYKKISENMSKIITWFQDVQGPLLSYTICRQYK